MMILDVHVGHHHTKIVRQRPTKLEFVMPFLCRIMSDKNDNAIKARSIPQYGNIVGIPSF